MRVRCSIKIRFMPVQLSFSLLRKYTVSKSDRIPRKCSINIERTLASGEIGIRRELRFGKNKNIKYVPKPRSKTMYCNVCR